MKINYNQLFCRDTNYLDFICCDNGKTYRGVVAGIITQRFGGVSYELGISSSEWKEIFDSIKYEDAPEGMRSSSGHKVSKVAEAKIELIIPVTKYYNVKIPGNISNFHIDDGLDMENGWFDCLYDEGIITEEEWDDIQSLQIAIIWEEMMKVLEYKQSGIFPKKDIFPDIDID